MKLKKEPHKGAPSLIMINLIRLALRVARKLAQNDIKKAPNIGAFFYWWYITFGSIISRITILCT
jgi:hypothetical protein